jgi:hypothetical protein
MVFVFKCNLCGNNIRKLFAGPAKRPPFLNCQCGGIMEVQLPEFSTTTTETVAMPGQTKKAVWRSGAQETNKENKQKYRDIIEKRDLPKRGSSED